MLQKIMTPASMEYDTGSLKKSKNPYLNNVFGVL